MKNLKFVVLLVAILSVVLVGYNIDVQAKGTSNVKQGTTKCVDILKASENGDLKGVKQCVADGVDINSSVKGGYTALQTASKYGHLDVVKFLIENGAKINQQVELEGTPEEEGGNIYSDTALMYASRAGHIDIVKYIIDKGADVNLKDFKGSTALIRASTDTGHIEIVKLLIKSGADINTRNIFNNGALAFALWDGHFDIAKYLIKSGADVNITDETGNTVLIWASGEGNIELVKLFIDSGASVNYKNVYSDQTALVLARESGHKDIVKYLQSKGAK